METCFMARIYQILDLFVSGGDCLAYTTAAAARELLLFVADDFRLTDIQPAW